MKSLKNNKYFCILLFAIFSLTACQTEQVSNDPPKKTLGVSMASMKEDVFSIMKEAMYDNMERDNIDIIWLDAKDDKEQQKKDISYLLEQDVDLIIMTPVDSKEAAKLVEKINKEEIPVIALDRIIENVQLSGYITADSFLVGLEQARYLCEQVEKGNIILLKGDKENNVAHEITAGNMEILKKNVNINIVVEEWHKAWSPELAEETVRNALDKHPDIVGVLANNSNMAMAAVNVLKEKNLIDKVITVGADASKEACIAIAKGEHDADVDKMPYVLGLTAFKAAVIILRDESWIFDRRIRNGEYSTAVDVTPVMFIDKYNLIAMKNRWDELNKYLEDME